MFAFPVVHFPNPPPGLRNTTNAYFRPPTELPDGQKWMIFLGGFFTFPLLCLGYYWADWAVGPKLWKSQIQELEERGLAQGSRGLQGAGRFMDSENLYNILQRANAETKALHDLILLWINPDMGLHAAKDTALLKEHPIKMSDGQFLEPDKAILIRILDKNSKTVVLLLGVDMSGHNGSESDPNLAWCHDYSLRSWMDDRAQELKGNNDAAEHGISLYCYTATSSATSLPGKKGETWQEARLFPEDLPSGFPLRVLETVKQEMAAEVS
ncbi:MAG: hypothetical protein Q9162_002245 [Coniocarpon cinnabarinum]